MARSCGARGRGTREYLAARALARVVRVVVVWSSVVVCRLRASPRSGTLDATSARSCAICRPSHAPAAACWARDSACARAARRRERERASVRDVAVGRWWLRRRRQRATAERASEGRWRRGRLPPRSPPPLPPSSPAMAAPPLRRPCSLSSLSLSPVAFSVVARRGAEAEVFVPFPQKPTFFRLLSSAVLLRIVVALLLLRARSLASYRVHHLASRRPVWLAKLDSHL